MLKIMRNGRYIEKDGKFFPYLADTAWTMPQKLNREEICAYLDKRRAQGFNAVQVSAISELDGLRIPNRENQLPFIKQNVSRPNNDYFSLITFIADRCEERGMVLVLLPYWGDKFNKMWGIGPEIFTPENSILYGKYLGSLIGKRENVIWMLGGDRPINNAFQREVIDETARGLREGESVYHLMTYHPNGESSSVNFLKDADYIDYHCLQSSHSFGGYKSEKMVSKSLKLSKKPCMDAECFYEDFPIDFDLERNYRFNDCDIRKRIYKNLITGACGHTYGHQSVWCFVNKTDNEYLYTWEQALDRPMAWQMQNINKLLEFVDITTAKACKSKFGGLMCKGKDFILVYLEDKEPCFLQLKEGEISSLTWFDPVSGEFSSGELNSATKPTLISPFEHDAIAILK